MKKILLLFIILISTDVLAFEKITNFTFEKFKKGETVAIIEAMKMELPVYAEEDGIVKAIICRAGQTVHSGEPLVYME